MRVIMPVIIDPTDRKSTLTRGKWQSPRLERGQVVAVNLTRPRPVPAPLSAKSNT